MLYDPVDNGKVGNPSKSAQLQIRVSPQEKAAIDLAARAAGMDMSAYVLKLVLPELTASFATHVEACRNDSLTGFALAGLNTFLSKLTSSELRRAVGRPAPALPSEYLANYVSAMVECACARAGIPAPGWTRSITPLAVPYFGSTLQSLRLYLLTHSPAPFRRRNIFIDSSVGAQV